MALFSINEQHPAETGAEPLETSVTPDREMQRVLRTAPVETCRIDDPFDTRLARWKHAPFHEVVKPMTDHVIMTYLGAMQRLERRSEGEYSTGMGRRGSVTFIPAGSSSRWDIHGPMDIVQLYLSPELLDRVARESPGAARPLNESTARPDNIMATLLELTLKSSGDAVHLQALYRQQLASLIAIHLVKTHSGLVQPADKALGGLAPRVLRTSLERLSSENDQDFSLGALADAANLSRFHFCRAFKRSTGLTPHEWLRQRRMEQAMAMLRDPFLQVTEIAGTLGYATVTAFGVAFKRHTGLTPGEWRRAVL
ncbi:helix-turn-helix transcriptional regulator [Agrobacterium tumefaciens]|uniref:helix-turn-helix transcriptional regulator n=1 Tax=Agrobacterium tumefaciens TaxID=358 RepID=UPI001573E810|nr:helix-turn-helix transcriptional regulator [Agrobacterium tumefaciens]WCJ65135.1 helix-turn-helix transcriptional regulator [Agrobacterium tumefaciens]